MFPIVLNLITWLVIMPIYFCLGYFRSEQRYLRLIRKNHLDRTLKRLNQGNISLEEDWRELGALDAYNDFLNMVINPENAPWPIKQLAKVGGWVKGFRKANPNGTK